MTRSGHDGREMSAKVLVTGSEGFVGRHLRRALVAGRQLDFSLVQSISDGPPSG